MYESPAGGTHHDDPGASMVDSYADTVHRRGSESLQVCKEEEHEQIESADTTFKLFASLLDSGLQGAYVKLLG